MSTYQQVEAIGDPFGGQPPLDLADRYAFSRGQLGQPVISAWGADRYDIVASGLAKGKKLGSQPLLANDHHTH
ncbi:hypothetical protein [Comamonas sp. NoAH]|uniref:hypothetical protein n=1 Tax=Comamonas halotolerans TaxID=3041496 RepID=UPI0024E0DDFC|nr:hypothetical protein [Comamonas sp. NoAH]